MAGITDLDKNYLNLLMKNYPEYKAGFMNTTPILGQTDLFNPPSGPLYDVQPNFDKEWTSYFEEGDPIPTGASPKGPLHNIDPGRTSDIISLPSVTDKDMSRYIDTIETYEGPTGGSVSQFFEPRYTTSFAEWQPKATNEISLTKSPLSNIGLRDYAKEYPGKTVWGSYSPVTGNIGINQDLMELFGTKPTSPRNEQLIDASAVGLGNVRPALLNNFVADVLAHEYGHGILDQPGFEDIRQEVMDTNINELFGNPPLEKDLSDFDKEEIFNELLDLQRGFRTSGRFSGILASKNPAYMNSLLNKYMKKKPKWGSAAMDYTNLMSPVADRYFAEVNRQGGQNPSAQSFRSAPGGLTQAQSRAARGDPKGTGGGWKWADGGLATMFERRR